MNLSSSTNPGGLRRQPLQLSALLLLVALAGCEFNLEVPEGPQRGSLKGVLDTGGNIPLSGNRIVAISDRGTQAEQTTGADGAFVFGDLAPGLYYLEINLPGFAPLTKANLRVKVGAELDVGTLKPAWLAGTASEATLIGKVVAGGGGDVNGAQVEFTLQAAAQSVAKTTIGSDGTFLQRLPPGVYAIKATHPNYTIANAQDISLSDGERKDLSSTPLVMDVNPATLTGTVRREVDRAAPALAQDVTVTLGNGLTTTTDSNGNFTFTGLAGGTQSIRFSLAGHHDPVSARTVELKPGQTTAYPATTLSLDRGAISGVALLGDGKPATNISVSVTGTPYSAVAVPTASDASRAIFTISGVPVGTGYQLSAVRTVADPPAYIPAVKTGVTIVRDVVSTVTDMTLQPMLGGLSIDDGDATNAPGYSATTNVTLVVANLTNAATYRASEDSTFANVSFANLPGASIPFTLSNTQGLHTVYFQYRDAAQNTSHTLTANIVLDTVAPTNASVSIEGGAPFTGKSSTLTLTLRADDPQSGATEVSGLGSVRINETGAATSGVLTATAQPYQQTLAYTRTGTGDGPQSVHVQFFDRAGNKSSIVVGSVVIDTTAPTGVLSVRRGANATVDGFTNTTFVEVEQTVPTEPNGGYVRIKLANNAADLNAAVYQPVAAVTNWFLAPGGDGVRTVYGVLQDAAGNSSGVLSTTVTYDKTPPAPVSATTAAVTRTTPITLTVSATDDRQMSPTAAVAASEDVFFSGATATALPTSSQITFPLSTTDGAKRVYVRFRDAAGNDSVVTVPVTLDTAAPTFRSFQIVGTLADGALSPTATSTASVSLQLDQEGASEYQVLTTDPAGTCPTTGYSALSGNSLPYVLSGTGVVNLWMCLRDAAGNVAAPIKASTRLDTSLPTGCALTLVGNGANGVAPPLNKTATRNVSHVFGGCTEAPAEIFFTEAATVTCSANGAFNWVPYTAGMEILLSSGDGTKTVRGCVRDVARNTGSFSADAIDLDTTAPSGARISINDGAAYVNGAATNPYSLSISGSATGAINWAVSETTTFSSFVPFNAGTPASLTISSGVGTRTANAVFRDDVGNLSPVVSDDIQIDLTGPDTSGISTFQIVPTVGSFITNRIANVRLQFGSTTAASDAPFVMLAEAASAAACADSDFSTVTATPRFDNTTFVLSASDGPKRLCLKLVDAAGNPSASFAEASITLDTTPPSAPVITTPTALVVVSNNTSFTVNTAGPVTEANFLKYQVKKTTTGNVGGVSSWTDVMSGGFFAPVGTTAFSFTLTGVNSNTYAAGVDNTFSIRAVDQAGHVGPEASVIITNDLTPPTVPQTSPVWVNNRSGRATFWWVPSSSPDVVRQEIQYGAASGSYSGQYALEGVSPIMTSSTQGSFTLSGLVNGNATFVRIVAFDRAGNSSPSFAEITLEPNIVSPNLLGTVNTSGANGAIVAQMTPKDDMLFTLLHNGNTCAFQNATMHLLDLSQIASPTRSGSIDAGVLPLPVGSPAPFAGTVSLGSLACGTGQKGNAGMAVELPWVFVPVGTKLQIVNVLNPATPTVKATVEFSEPLGNVVARGRRVFVHSLNGKIFALDVSKLYDEDATTVPAFADVVGTVADAGTSPGHLVLSRNTLMHFDFYNTTIATYRADDALDNNTATAWDELDRLTGPTALPGGGTTFGKGASTTGNHLYTYGSGQLNIRDLSPIYSGGVPTNIRTDVNMQHGARGGNVLGAEFFSFDSSIFAFKFFDTTSLTSPVLQATTRQTPSGVDSLATFGPYFFGTSFFGGVTVHETVRPDGARVRARTSLNASPGEVDGTFWYGAGATYDLQQSTVPQLTDSGANQCVFDQARWEERVVQPEGRTMVVWNYDTGVDRNASTTMPMNNPYFSRYTLPAPSFDHWAKAIEAYGNYAVVVEQRGTAASPDGMYIELFDMNGVRNTLTLPPQLTASDSKGAFRFTTSLGRPTLAVSRGKAYIGMYRSYPSLATEFYVVDLRPMIDDDAATTMSAAQVQGPVLLPSNPSANNGRDRYMVKQVVVRGSYAYMTAPTGLIVLNIAAPLPGSVPAATLPITVSLSNPSPTSSSGLNVYGSWAFLTRSRGNGVTTDFYAIDVSNPLTPFIVSRAQVDSQPKRCQPIFAAAEDSDHEIFDSVHVAGSRAYVGYGTELYTFDLE